MAKIHTIQDISMRYIDEEGNTQVAFIPKYSYIEVTEEMAIFFCDEDIEQMSIAEQKMHRRTKKAVRTGFFSMNNLTKPHLDYTFL